MERKTKISDPAGTLLMVAGAGLLSMLVGTASAQTRDASPAPRTAWGDPDLRGIWDFRSLTPFERPVEFGKKKELSEEEAAEESPTIEAGSARRSKKKKGQWKGGCGCKCEALGAWSLER